MSSKLKKKIKRLRKFLGPRVNFDSNPHNAKRLEDRFLLEYLYELEKRYYKKSKHLYTCTSFCTYRRHTKGDAK